MESGGKAKWTARRACFRPITSSRSVIYKWAQHNVSTWTQLYDNWSVTSTSGLKRKLKSRRLSVEVAKQHDGSFKFRRFLPRLVCLAFIERFPLRARQSCEFIGTKQSVYISLVHQHSRRFIILEQQWRAWRRRRHGRLLKRKWT